MLAAGTTLGPYRIVAALGAGGMGEVYRAHDSRLGRDVAIKVLPPRSALSSDARARFEREARTISQLSHTHICALYDVGREGDTDYLVMELLEGETLAHRLSRGPLAVADVLRLGAEIASALDRAHAAGVVHRDLKPGNVMLTRSGAKLMDFGLARVGASPANASSAALSASPTMTQPLTGEGAIVGTFQYMAPEQLEGKDADARADIWALGCVLYEMATGKRAFAGESQASLIGAIMRDDPRPIGELQPLTPPALGHVVSRCLAKDPTERWQSARDVGSVLEMARGASSVARADVGARARRRPRVAAMIGAVLFAALATVIGHYAWKPAPAAQPEFSRLTYRRGRITNARFTADGKSVVYAATWDGKPMELFEARTDLSSTRSLNLTGTTLKAVSSTNVVATTPITDYPGDGYQWGPLSLVPLSGGAPRAVLDDVSVADWARDGRTLAVVRRVAGENRIEMPPGHVLLKSQLYFTQLRVAPDGRTVAFAESPLNDMRGVVGVVDLAGQRRTLTHDWDNVYGLAWRPDGREVWFTALQGRAVRRALYAVTMVGRVRLVLRSGADLILSDIAPDGRVLLVDNITVAGIRAKRAADPDERDLGWLDYSQPADVSTDGQTLLFNETGELDGPYSAYVRGMDGSPAARIGEGPALGLSPDGKWVIVRRFTRPMRLVLLPTGVGDSLALPAGPVQEFSAASWLPDGRRIVFEGAERGQLSRLYVQRVPDGTPRPISPPGTICWTDNHVLNSPDGRWVAGVMPERRLVVFPVDGGAPKDVAELQVGEWLAQWGPDGTSILVYQPGPRLRLFRIDMATGARSEWNSFTLADPAGTVLDAPFLSRDGKSYAIWYSRRLCTLFMVTGLE